MSVTPSLSDKERVPPLQIIPVSVSSLGHTARNSANEKRMVEYGTGVDPLLLGGSYGPFWILTTPLKVCSYLEPSTYSETVRLFLLFRKVGSLSHPFPCLRALTDHPDPLWSENAYPSGFLFGLPYPLYV